MPVNQSPDPLIGRTVDGRYHVLSRIARGGMATVYLATDKRLERRVALKVMHSHLTDDVAFRDRFIQEARSAARLAHPNVVNVFDQGQEHEMAYLVMEYLPGITLRDLLNEQHVLTAEQTIDIMSSVLAGLAAAHRAGIVHRDLKPENVLLADDGRIKIGDFGLARAASAATATGQALLGTVAYLSPELVTRGVADTRSDIYAIGIMLYEMLAGEQPFKGDQPMQIAFQHANESVPAPSGRNPRVPVELDELVLWATARDPERRPKDAGMLLEELKNAAASIGGGAPTALIDQTLVMPASAPPPTAPTQRLHTGPTTPAVTSAVDVLQRTARRRKAKGGWLLALVLVLAGVAGGTGWWFGAGPGAQAAVPAVAGLDPDAARTQLVDAGFLVADELDTEASLEIDEGLVIRSVPADGAVIDRSTEIVLVVSSGPETVVIPADLKGKPADEVRAALEELRLDVDTDVDRRFSKKYDLDTVMRITDGDAELEAGAEVLQGSRIRLLVSAGTVPTVAGDSVDDAIAKLAAAGLTVTDQQQRYDEDVPKDEVIGIVDPNKTRSPGENVILVVSRGPEMLTVPDGLVGKTIGDAVAQLQELGFDVSVESNIPKSRWDDELAIVVSTTPTAGEKVRKSDPKITVVGYF